MLQINSGRFFKHGVGPQNRLRGVIYTNLRLGPEGSIETVAGTLLPTDTLQHSSALVYELTEQIEAQPVGPGVLVSHGAEPYLQDFSAISSFVLNAVCTPDSDLARRLTSGKRGLATRSAPQQLVRLVFDAERWCQPEDAENLVRFVKQLIGLKRTRFLAAMRAIRTYVTGLHRIADDLELAYTLLVASVESLAQEFDGHRAAWEDLDQRKRSAIDGALAGASQDVALQVRAAILEGEHVALKRRFRDFSLEHVDPAYFRDEAVAIENPVRRADLPELLGHAYRMRSRYIHNLQELPRILTLGGGSFSETANIKQDIMLTLQGLARLSRHVIRQFVMRQPIVESEDYDYSHERAGIVSLQLAPQYWIWRPENITAISGRMILEGFLDQAVGVLINARNAQLTDLRAMLARVEDIMPSMKVEQRRRLLACYCMFNRMVREEDRSPNSEAVLKAYEGELLVPSSESMLVQVVLGLSPAWDLSQHDDAHESYFAERFTKSGLRAPRALEAGISLTLAERHRQAGNSVRARELIAFAVENFPGQLKLELFERNYSGDTLIDWEDLLFPAESPEQKHGVT